MRLYKPFACALLLFVSGCMVGPKYHQPKVKLPDKFSEQQQAQTVADLKRWWTFFDDSCLNDLIGKALKNNYDLRIAIEKIKELRAMYRIEEAKLFPEIDGIGQANANQYSQKLIVDKFFPAKLSYFQLGFDALWELDFWGKQRRARAAAYDIYQAQIEDMRDVYIIMLGDVAKTYTEIRALQQKLDLLDATVKCDTQLLALTHDRLASGIASEIPDADQQAALNESQSQRILVLEGLKQTINRLAVLLGENPEEFTLLPGAHVVPQSTKALAVGLPSELLRRRPDIRRVERLLASATESYGQAIADWFPSFSLLGSLTPEANHENQLFGHNSLTWSIGPSMRWPLITFGRIQFNVEEKKSVQRQALLTYAKSVVTALGDVENWLTVYWNENERVGVLTQKLAAATRQRDLYTSRFEGGLDSEVQWLVAEKNRLTMALELVDVQLASSSSLISVYKALGGGW
jgi:NodT family efflux transporter outer membrane factor (OMF) lipoprotein